MPAYTTFGTLFLSKGTVSYSNAFEISIARSPLKLKRITPVSYTHLFLNFSRQIDASENEINEDYRLLDQAFGGFVETDDNYLSKLGYKVVSGRLPDGTKNEIAVSKYISELFVFAKYIKNEDEVIGKTFEDVYKRQSRSCSRKIKPRYFNEEKQVA